MSSETTAENQCANCSKPATNMCGRCHGASEFPTTNETAPAPKETYYCSTECQKEHWKEHKNTCKVFETRIKLSRVSLVLKSMTMLVRRRIFDGKITSLDREGNEVVYHVDHGNENEILSLGLAYDITDVDQAVNGLILQYGASGVVETFLYPMVQKLMQGVSARITKAGIIVVTPREDQLHVRASTHLADAPYTHKIFHVVTETDEHWVLNPLGSQVGYDVPLEDYKTHCAQVKNNIAWFDFKPAHIYPQIRNELDEIAEKQGTDAAKVPSANRLALGGIGPALKKAILVLELRFKAALGTMLSGSEEAFAKKLRVMLDVADAHLKSYLDAYYADLGGQGLLRYHEYSAYCEVDDNVKSARDQMG